MTFGRSCGIGGSGRFLLVEFSPEEKQPSVTALLFLVSFLMAFDRAPNLLPGIHGQGPPSCLEQSVTTTAILVDGNFYLHRARALWGKTSPEARADELHAYALRHITHARDAKTEFGKRSLYRIFYYDCPPLMEGSVYQPWDGRTRGFSRKSSSNKWSADFQATLGAKRKVAMRMGTIMAKNMAFNLKQESLKRLLKGELSIDDLAEADFTLSGIKQSGVDMRIGLDVASLASGRMVDQIVLIAGDADFVPVAKTARRAGVDFLIDPMGHHISDELCLHVDGIEDLSARAK